MSLFTSEINKILKGYNISDINIGCSDTNVYKASKDNEILFLKIGKAPLLSKEYVSLMWLKGKLPVPDCVYFTNDAEKEYLITKAVKGEMSCSDKNLKSPEETIKLLAKAIKLIQNVEISNCPFRSDLTYKLGVAEFNVKNKLLSAAPISEIGKELKDYNSILSYLQNNKPKEELVFSHGDTSLPNIFFNKGKVSGFIDVGECGVADKWFDIAICYKSIRRNFPNRQDLLDLFLSELSLKYSTTIEYYLTLMDLYL